MVTPARRPLQAILALVVAIIAGAAAADEYPSHPIKLLVGFSAGGGLDISCRHWAQRLSARIGQPVVVENRPGASGELAVKQAMASKPDGYTLVCLSSSNTISSSKPNPPFDIRSDVIPVIQMTRFTFALYVNPTLPVKSVAELVAYAKTRPGQLNYASVGTGSTTHLAFEVIKLNTGMDIVHVPFKGTAQTAAAVMAGDVQVGLDAIAAVKSNFDSGRLRPLAVISAQRTPPMPSLPGHERGRCGRRRHHQLHRRRRAREDAEGNRRPAEPAFERGSAGAGNGGDLRRAGLRIAGGSPEDFLRVIGDDAATWSRVIRVADIKFE